MMKTLWLATLLAACVDPSGAPEVTLSNHYAVVLSSADNQPASPQPSVGNIATAAALVPDNICSLLPIDGSCAAACDPALLATEIPRGVCADFACTLTDGRVIRYGGCSPN